MVPNPGGAGYAADIRELSGGGPQRFERGSGADTSRAGVVLPVRPGAGRYRGRGGGHVRGRFHGGQGISAARPERGGEPAAALSWYVPAAEQVLIAGDLDGAVELVRFEDAHPAVVADQDVVIGRAIDDVFAGDRQRAGEEQAYAAAMTKALSQESGLFGDRAESSALASRRAIS